jgi:Putative DNA-binding domain
MNSTQLAPLIQKLIASQREGDHWDFKAMPHENNAKLLHDLLCLANSLHKGDRYLILGVADPRDGGTITGLQPTTPGRKTQADYIDFLRNISFAGANRPHVTLVTVQLEGQEVDILIIADLPGKPYWITQDYVRGEHRVRQHIYTRVGDSNTPLDQSADSRVVEQLWRQRFGLDMPPLERMRHLLREPANWTADFDTHPDAYHQVFPDYQLKLSPPQQSWEPYSYFFLNKNCFQGTAALVYRTTVLAEVDYVYVDEMRLLLPQPAAKSIPVLGRPMWYYYYLLSEPVGDVFTFLTADRPHLDSRGTAAPFLVFQDPQQQAAFHRYAAVHQAQLAAMSPGHDAQFAAQAIAQDGYNPVIDVRDVTRIKQLYELWRSDTTVP